jgi:hypothetical protein
MHGSRPNSVVTKKIKEQPPPPPHTPNKEFGTKEHKGKDTPNKDKSKDTPTKEKGKETPTKEKGKDTPTKDRDTPTKDKEPGKEKPKEGKVGTSNNISHKGTKDPSKPKRKPPSLDRSSSRVKVFPLSPQSGSMGSGRADPDLLGVRIVEHEVRPRPRSSSDSTVATDSLTEVLQQRLQTGVSPF